MLTAPSSTSGAFQHRRPRGWVRLTSELVFQFADQFSSTFSTLMTPAVEANFVDNYGQDGACAAELAEQIEQGLGFRRTTSTSVHDLGRSSSGQCFGGWDRDRPKRRRRRVQRIKSLA